MGYLTWSSNPPSFHWTVSSLTMAKNPPHWIVPSARDSGRGVFVFIGVITTVITGAAPMTINPAFQPAPQCTMATFGSFSMQRFSKSTLSLLICQFSIGV
jgi:hypothetical protein